MQIVIEISETLKGIADEDDFKTFSHFMWQTILMDALKNGVVLPETHERLIESERLKEVFRRNTGHDYHDLIDVAPTILDATEG